jgi:hypothetical protein
MYVAFTDNVPVQDFCYISNSDIWEAPEGDCKC